MLRVSIKKQNVRQSDTHCYGIIISVHLSMHLACSLRRQMKRSEMEKLERDTQTAHVLFHGGLATGHQAQKASHWPMREGVPV
ncbi:hypothetical protein CEXT_403981 [Caerostris extrusa]|uniref:Uncharacterized protein n=1 Tax=Caerostris extrusa TaxID=172846 RepID=A0AAV4RN43_CAEEX|nr:hypothetical protein CEXT_403981 [Caerostris extrusa]